MAMVGYLVWISTIKDKEIVIVNQKLRTTRSSVMSYEEVSSRFCIGDDGSSNGFCFCLHSQEWMHGTWRIGHYYTCRYSGNALQRNSWVWLQGIFSDYKWWCLAAGLLQALRTQEELSQVNSCCWYEESIVFLGSLVLDKLCRSRTVWGHCWCSEK